MPVLVGGLGLRRSNETENAACLAVFRLMLHTDGFHRLGGAVASILRVLRSRGLPALLQA